MKLIERIRNGIKHPQQAGEFLALAADEIEALNAERAHLNERNRELYNTFSKQSDELRKLRLIEQAARNLMAADRWNEEIAYRKLEEVLGK